MKRLDTRESKLEYKEKHIEGKLDQQEFESKPDSAHHAHFGNIVHTKEAKFEDQPVHTKMHFNNDHHKEVGMQIVNLSHTNIFQRMASAFKNALKTGPAPQHKSGPILPMHNLAKPGAHPSFTKWEKAKPAFAK
jgi:hypothetical protein